MTSALVAAANALAKQTQSALERSTIGQTLAKARLEVKQGRNPQKLLDQVNAAVKRGELRRVIGSTPIVQAAKRAAKKARQAGNDAAFRDILRDLGPMGEILEASVNSTANITTRRKREEALMKGLLSEYGFDAQTAAGRSNLKALGFKVAPKKEQKERRDFGKTKRGQDRKQIEIRIGGKNRRFKTSSPVITGEMINVRSSNVHSIGFDIDWQKPERGTLKIRFLGGKGKDRVGEGPLYHYDDVPLSKFEQFAKAASKGEWVWDEVRVRGTVSQHQYEYRLAGITGGYVPRAATLRRKDQEWYLQRQFADEDGRIYRSKRPNQFVRKIDVNRGTPNRGKGRRK